MSRGLVRVEPMPPANRIPFSYRVHPVVFKYYLFVRFLSVFTTEYMQSGNGRFLHTLGMIFCHSLYVVQRELHIQCTCKTRTYICNLPVVHKDL